MKKGKLSRLLLAVVTVAFASALAVPAMAFADEVEEPIAPETAGAFQLLAEADSGVEKVVELDGVPYDSIKDALWTLKSTDTATHTLKVLKDHEIDVNYSTYNYPILVNGFNVTLDLNGKTITADWSKYTGTREDNALIGVCNGGKLDVIDSVGGGKIVNNDDRDDVENRIFWIMTSTADKSIEVNIKGGTFVQNEENTALLYVQGNKPSDNLAPLFVTISGGHFESVNDDFFNAYDGYSYEAKIVGGTFSKDPTDWEIKLADDYKAVESDAGVWGVAPMGYVAAKVNDDTFYTLEMAIDAANRIDSGAIVTLFDDITLGKKLTISGNVTISGAYTITRANAYTGTLFEVAAGATLTLDGGLTIDGGNEYVFSSDLYKDDLDNWQSSVPADQNAKWFTPEEGAPVATAYMITTSGKVNLKDVTIKNHYSTNGSGIVSASSGAEVTLAGAQITHNASTSGSGLVVNASAGVWSREQELITLTMNEGTVIDGNHVGGNHGIFKVYMGTYFTMNGGEIKNTTGWNSNGVAVGIYHAVFTMNGGTICSNSSVYGPNNGRNAAVYGHSNHLFTMTGGTICHNTGRSKAGVDSPYSEAGYTGLTEIKGGSVLDNTVLGPWTEPDVSGGATLAISGGTFTQDVSKWLAPGYGLPYDEESGTYTVTDDYLVEVNGLRLKSIAEAVERAASMEGQVVIKVLAPHAIEEPVVLDGNFVVDLNGNTVYVKGEEDGEGAFTVPGGSSATIRNGAIDNANPNLSGVWSAGELKLEGVDISSARHAVRIEGGEADIDGGTYAVKGTSGATSHALNVSGDSSVTVNGGSFSGPRGTSGDSGSAVKVQRGSEVTVNGGAFDKGLNDTLSVDEGATLSLKGGQYDQDPSAYAADGYDVSEGDGLWTVSAPYIPVVPSLPLPDTGCGDDAACNFFNDVDPDAWYHEYVDWAHANDILRGYDDGSGNVGPEDATLRSHVMVMLHRMAGEPAAADDPGFADVKPGAWYYDAVAWAKSVGLTTGYLDGSGNFGPADVMTREQMATVLYRFAVLNGCDVESYLDTNILSYADAEDVSEYAVEAMQWAVGAGIISGYDDGSNCLGPKDDAERGQFAAMLMRMDDAYGIL